ncbi:hypothetical protein FOA52_002017 [Chlamydomonas sp. UWO 241]|nr:hypothetical protein FOA52_002017 [Chlamydomonas sp. UWO 241]
MSGSGSRPALAPALQPAAILRLQHALRQLQVANFCDVVAVPYGDDLSRWSCNMVACEGKWKGMVVHLHLQFHPDYPMRPPTVEIQTPLEGHPNIFGSYICLDMLTQGAGSVYGGEAQPYQGWSTAYTVSSVLQQLLGFLLVDTSIDQDYGNVSVKRSDCRRGLHSMEHEKAAALRGVAARNAQPQGRESEGKGKEVADAAKEASAAAGAGGRSSPTAVCSLVVSEGASGRTSDSSGAVEGTTTVANVDLLALLDDPLLRCVLQRLRPQDLHRCQRVGGRLARVAADVLQRSELQCFHSKLGFGDALLGFGVQRSWHYSSSQLRGVSVAAGEYLSYAAFQKGVRLSAWNAPFDAFLPLYLNPEHGARCMKELPMFVAGLNDRGCSSGQTAGVRCVKVEARALLRVLGHMLNSLVVELMGGEVDKNAGPPTRALSDASLQAFCHLHHLLLAVALQPGSGVVELARRDVCAFMMQPEARTKEACPDLGVLLVELLLVPCSDAPWEQFAPVLLREVLARQVRWAIKETGDWFGCVGRETASPNGDSVDDVRRLRTHWECGKALSGRRKWKGMVVHLHLEFQPDYPMRPPTVRIQTPLAGHPNIYGSYICLDMLTQPQGKEGEGKGEAVAAKEAPAAAGVSGSSSPSAVCSLAASEGVGASGRTSDSSGTVQGTTTFAAAADVDIDLLALLDDPLLHCVLQRLRPQDLHRCQRVGGRLARVAADVLQRSELQCFHSKLGFGDALLGFGVQRSWHHSSSQLRGVSVAAGEYLSYAAFQKGVRLSAWNGGTPFDAFLPLYLNPEHGARCMKELPMFVDGLNDRGCSSGQPAGVRCAKVYARALLRVLGHMLNSLVVELMGGVVCKDAGPPTRALSDASLQAFCHLHHLLLAVALQPGSGVAELARHDVRAFMTQPAARTKEACPDLGVLLVELLLVPCSDAPWEQFAPVLLREVLARQVRWAIKETGDWFGSVGRETASPNGDSVDDVRRLRTHWECGKVGLRLVMLQTWFANALARPLSAATATADLARAKRAYDECSGLPPRATMDAFATHARSVVAATKWLQVLAALRLGFRHGANPRAVFAAALRQAVLDSHRARYHASPSPGAPPRVHTAAPSAAAGEWQSVTARERAVPCYLDWCSAPIGMTANVWV